MSDFDPIEIIKEGLGPYPLTQTVAEAIKFFLNNHYESMVIANEKGDIEFIGRLTEELFKLSPGEGKGKNVLEIIPYSELPDVISTGVPHIGRITKAPDGPTVISRFPLIRDGKVLGAIGKIIFHSFEEIERLKKEAEQLRIVLLNTEKKIRSEYQANCNMDHILGISDKIIEQKELARRMAKTNSDILIVGESGTGKEMFAHSMHNASKNKEYPFIKVNCPAIPIEIAESELFGYEKGAFTGAKQEGKPGKFELAEGGTIFLDEIGTLPLSIQAKLLRVIQEREVERLGSKKPLKLNFRLISATNIDLRKLAEEGKFRFDLYFRLSKGILTLPPLRERKKDIPVYVSHYLKILNKNLGMQVKEISNDALATLINHHWLGNVRELANILEQSFFNMNGAEILDIQHLPAELNNNFSPSPVQRDTEKPLREIVQEIEKENIVRILRQFKGNKREAAKCLGIHRSALYLKLKKFGLT